MLLSILMPVFNEVSTVVPSIKRVLGVDYPCPVELVLVEDGSTDGTIELLKTLDEPGLSIHFHDRNRGKGAAIRTAASKATGDYLIICDADLEYAPEDIPALLRPVLEGDAEVVLGPVDNRVGTEFGTTTGPLRVGAAVSADGSALPVTLRETRGSMARVGLELS